jgi:hypothetical protein
LVKTSRTDADTLYNRTNHHVHDNCRPKSLYGWGRKVGHYDQTINIHIQGGKTMIIVGAKNTGKKLVNAIVREINKHGHVTLAALSDKGVNQINSAGQKVANALGYRISANPRQDEITLDGVHRVALIVELRRNEEE